MRAANDAIVSPTYIVDLAERLAPLYKTGQYRPRSAMYRRSGSLSSHLMVLPTILIVDDSIDTAEMYALGLSHAGYRTLTAGNARSAVDAVKTRFPSAVVVDLHMPEVDGWALIETLKSDPETSHIPLVLLTGWTAPHVATKGSLLGCAAVLFKPCLPDDLATTVSSVLRRT